jgi:hypothetical protein
MARNQQALKDDLLPSFTILTIPPQEIAARRASAYAKYAATATSCAGGAVTSAQIQLARQLLESMLTVIYATSKDLANTVQQEAAAHAAFWLGLIFVAAPVPGTVLVPLPAPILYADLYARLLLNQRWFPPAPTPSSAEMADIIAGQYASALHAATSLVVVAHPFPTSCVGPIS